jgi:prepilin-type N-terminal cleavage/methylation domain-containing protein
MRARIQAARENESGFTLVELLIVIVILGVLAGIVVFSVSGITGRGAAAACKSDVASVQVATEAYYAKNGSYPADVAALVTANFLKAAPTAETITTTAGVVTSNPLCSTLS